MHHLFLTRCGVYVVVFSLSALSAKERQVEVLDRIFYWLNSIRTHASGAPIFLVGTHADEVATREEHQTLNSVLENYLKRKKTTFKKGGTSASVAQGGVDCAHQGGVNCGAAPSKDRSRGAEAVGHR